MDLNSLFRNIFGIPDRKPPEHSFDRDETMPRGNDFRNPIWNQDDDTDDEDFRSAPGSNFSFQIFTNPVEMHRFFEHQMHEILKSFQSTIMSELPPNFGESGFPAIGPPQEIPDKNESPRGSLRDKYLKPSPKTELPTPWFFSGKKTDTDLDERIKSSGLDSVFKNQPIERPLEKIPQSGFQAQVFGRSFTSKTVRRPDGTVEHQQTTRDNQGNEETTVTRQVGDQTYSVTTKRDPSGVEERTENFVNIDEENLPEFKKKWSIGPKTDSTAIDRDLKPHNWFPFENFFPSH